MREMQWNMSVGGVLLGTLPFDCRKKVAGVRENREKNQKGVDRGVTKEVVDARKDKGRLQLA